MILDSERLPHGRADLRACMHHLVEARARRSPDAVAVTSGDERLTYAALDRRASRLAGLLRRHGVGPEVRVGICLDRSPEMVVGMLAAWKAGGTYVPLDPAYPAGRLAYMARDAGVRTVLTSVRLAGVLEGTGAEPLLVDEVEGTPPEEPGAPPAWCDPDTLAYVIYTSGSTGRPKGVGVTHRGLCNTALALGGFFRVGPDDRLLQFASPSFDAAVCEAAVALAAGAELHLAAREALLPGQGLLELLAERGITNATLPPAVLSLLPPAELPSLRTLVVAGEACPAELVRRWAPDRRFVNAYGPTEAAICATAAACEPGVGTPPIGEAIPGASVHVLDGELAPTAEGELYIGGAGVARGYLGRPDLTAERFVPDPFSEVPGARLYRSGDLARRRPDGALEFAGRVDEQVKVRGHRIEPGEVAAALASHPGIAQAAVAAREDGAEGRQLVAYVVGEAGGGLPTPGELREFLGRTLPEYMVPSAFVALDALPLTPNGKLDRAALPAPGPERPALSSRYVAPRTEAEREVAAVWAEVLGIGGIGAEDSFTELGGHSLAATQVAARLLHASGVEVPLGVLLGGGTVAEAASALEAARARGAAPGHPPLRRVPRGDGVPLPLSLAQEQVWFLMQLNPDIRSYHAHAAITLRGELDAPALEAALTAIVGRHEIFRTTFPTAGGRPVQRIHGPWAVRLPRVDFSGLPEGEREAAVAAWMREDFRRSFDLSRLPLVRWTLLRISGREHRLVYVEHHFLHDGWSFGVFLREFLALYAAELRGEPSPLPELPVQFADFAVWHREMVSGERARAELAYWREKLAGADPALELPTDRPRPPVLRFRGSALRTRIPPRTVRAVRAFTRRGGATLYMTLLAAFEALLHRYSGQEDFCVGGAVANRSWKETEPLIGMIVNTVAFRAQLGAVRSFRELVAQVSATTREAYAHKDVSFGQVVEAVQPERSLSRLPIYQVGFGAHDSPYPDLGSVPGLALEFAEALNNGSAKFDLQAVIIPRAEQWPGAPEDEVETVWEYSTDLFERSTVERMVRHYHALLDAALADPEAGFREVPLLDPSELSQVLEWGSGAAAAGAFVHELFAAQARRTPGAVAVECAGSALTYAELERRANGLAHLLRERGVGPETRVGVCLERSPELLVALLGTWKAGGAYAPLDPAHPAERLRFQVEDADAAVLVTRRNLAEQLPAGAAEVLFLEGAGESAAPPEPSAGPENLAYVIYTSGSTGRPKGVMVEHRSLAGLLPWAQAVFGFRAGEVVPTFASHAFDIWLFEALAPLLVGATVRLVPQGAALEPAGLRAGIAGAAVVQTVPALMRQVVESARAPGAPAPEGVRRVLVGGEAVPPELLRELREVFPGAEVHVLYGPTEATILASSHHAADGPAAGHPIGAPLPGVRLYVCDEAGAPLPAGVPGELRIGGAGVARGYHGRPELTAERFVPDPFAGEAGARAYRTGDRVRWLPGGVLDFLGRTDQQVKVRGFRVEPGEVEAALAAHPAVREAVVEAREDGSGERRLAGYVVPRGEAPAPGELREWLKRLLPEHMVPGAVVFLDALPLTPTGKVDRRKLPAPETGAAAGFVAPRTPVEEVLAEVWAGVLGVGRVGVEDDFFALGGHSLLATRVAAQVRDVLGVDLPVHALFAAPTLGELARSVEALGAGAAAPIRRAPRDPRRAPPLSFAQERLWFLERLDPGRPTYNLPVALRLGGELDAAALEEALRELVRRHEPLRTTVADTDEGPVQVVHPAGGPALAREGLDALPEAAREEALRGRLSALAAAPFDLREGPLFAATLLRLAPDEHVLVLRMHHAVADGWSIGVLHRELAALYSAFRHGEPCPLGELPVRYADYAVWQREQLAGDRLAAQLAYWRERLDGAPAVLELPADRPRPAAAGHHGAVHPLEVEPGTLERLRALARGEGATLFMALLAAWDALLARCADVEEVVVGTPATGRARPELEGLVGFFVNTLALRADLSGNPTFRELVARVRGATLRDLAHQELPFEQVVEAVAPERSRSRNPLFQAMFVLRDPPAEVPGFAGLRARPEPLAIARAKFDLTLAVEEAEGGLRGGLEYSTELFDPATAGRIAGHFRRLLAAVADDPDRRLSAVPLLDAEERRRLLEWGTGAAAGEPGTCVHELFEAQARRTPDAPAVVCGGRALTYAELDRRANQLAHHLRGRGAGPETRVGVRLERSVELAVALLGTWKAGAAYVPLDPAGPEERSRLLVDDAGAALVLASADLADALAGPAHAPAAPAGPRSLAYVLYTSGSTGAPKGVMVEHGELAAHVLAVRGAYGIGPEDRVLQFAAAVFDPFLEQLLPALTCGAAVVMRPPELWSPAELARQVAEQGVTVANLPTAYWSQAAAEWAAAGASPPGRLRLVIPGGERMPAEGAALWRRGPMGRVRLLNAYGPTEATITATLFEVPRDRGEAGGRVPVGRPLPGRRAYVLDAAGEPAPAGVPGELYLGGAGVARGYLARPALTAERFVPDPLAGEPGARMYRTGDRARWLPGGVLDLLGRTDQQLKVRGFRVEPGEVEAALAAHPGVREAVVVAREDGGAERRLAAYVVPGAEAPAPGELREWVKRRLPEYMVPGAVVILDSFPLTATGKVDRRALPAPGAGDAPGRVAPRTSTEALLAELWAGVLGVGRVGVEDDFFALGGHSLLATRVVARVRDAFRVDLPLRALFEAPTVAGLAACVDAARRGGAAAPPIAGVPEGAPLPLSFAQERLWFLDRLDPGRPLYNLGSAIRLAGELHVEALERAVDALLRRHDALRTRFPVQGGAPAQVPAPAEGFRLEVEDLAALPADAREEAARRGAADVLRRPYDLASGPLFRARLFRLGGGVHVLVLAMHHAVSDGWSMEVLFRELGTLYDAFRRGEEPRLPALPVRYGDYAAWQREVLRAGALDPEVAYWTGRLAGAPPALELPFDRPRPAEQSFRGAIHSTVLPPSLPGALRALGRQSGATLFMTLLAAFDVLLARWSGEDDVVVGTPVAGRTRPELQDVVGLFVNTLALRADVSGSRPFRELLGAVRAGAIEAYAHQELPFDRLVDELGLPRDSSRNPVFQVLFTLQDADGAEPRLEGVESTLLPVMRSHAIFDLSLTVRESAGGLETVWDYATDLFDAATVERMTGSLHSLLAAAAADPDRPVADLPLLGEADRGRVLAEWSRGPGAADEGHPLHEMVAERARRTPGAVALRFRDEALTCAELDRRANRLARHLQRLGVRREGVVGLCLDHGIEQVAAVLAVHRAGGAYLPLDPSYPADRLSFMLEDSGARILLTETRLGRGLAAPGVVVVCLDEERPEIEALDPTPPGGGAEPADLAYVIYTSGSTGLPKGVQVEQRSLTHTLAHGLAGLEVGPGDEVHALASYAFDIWLVETLLPLAAGATVRLVPREEVLEVDRVAAGLERATVLHAVPALMRQVVDQIGRSGRGPLTGMRRVLIGGDVVPPELLADVRSAFPAAELSAMYGPTEGTIVCARHPVAGDAGGRRLMGRPLPGVALYLLDAGGQPVPPGVPGEVYVGGPGVARGYRGRPGLTAERFVPDPFSDAPGARLYRTGDRARWRADGSLDFVGRADHQVKVRGFRVELGEVEAVLAGHPAVREAVVLALGEAGGDRSLRACIVPDGETPPAAGLRDFLRERLPEHMVPSEYLALDALPLSPTGKVDRRALAEMEAERGEAERPAEPPLTPVEEAVAGIWAEVLGLAPERVGRHDSFFELGGHSILLVRAAAQVQEAFRVELPIRRFFDAPTVAELSALLVAEELRPGQAEKIAVIFNRISRMSVGEVAHAVHGSTPGGQD